MSQEEFAPEEVALFEADAAEAEAGYPIEFLRACKVVGGRPLEVGSEAAQVVQFRLDPARLRALDARAAAVGATRSEVLRRAVDRELAA
ncbi:MAG: ribbon-helix-helix protein, CopG family [Bifidobacteriaceae bacterium]|nr:ribbon-helix-helix protein, CopG family [Bifidobacteriaceae bacterium]